MQLKLGFIPADNQLKVMTLDFVNQQLSQENLETNQLKQVELNLLVHRETYPAQAESLSKYYPTTIHEYEPINFESFNMHEPLIEIDLYTKLLEKYNIKIGRMNYLNNTTYMTVSGSDHIFQTDLLKGSLETLGLSDFIDSRIFSPEIKNIKKFQVFKENQKTPSLQFVQTEKNWTLRNYGRASSKKIQDKILTILNIKAHKIVDKLTKTLPISLRTT